jgi:hypothetical protein
LKDFAIKTPEKEKIRHAGHKKSHHPAAVDNVYENTNPSKWLDQLAVMIATILDGAAIAAALVVTIWK